MTRASLHGKSYDRVWVRIRAVLSGLAGLSALVAGTALFALLPHAMSEERALHAATESPGTATRVCLRAAWFTVESVRVHRGKGPGGRVEVSGSDEAAGEVTFSGVSEFLEQVRPGDCVAGTIWRGEIIVLWEGEAGQRTDAHPEGASQSAAGVGIILFLGGGWGVHASLWHLRTREPSAHRRRPHPLARSGWTVAGLSAWTLLLLLVLYGWNRTMGAFFAGWIPAALAAGAFLVHGGLRGRERR
ncbi:hypothetical protein AB0C77_00370 [Streptomyces sp. NPDC048629]|uniref:hypothetical protein n=1 Tax=Streptomyces sp. NPDC048629 TaxID=3154824 RepID=UPI003423A7DA